jgi:uncharacterized membrane protein (UPF0127 family)
MGLFWTWGLPVALLLAGCEQPGSPGASAKAPAVGTASATNRADEPHYHLDHAQPTLPSVKLWIGSKEMAAEVCVSVTQISTGMMFRQSIGPNEGMLFVFGGTDRRSFYMKNVPIDIAAAYLDSEGVVQEIVQLKQQEVTPVPSQSANIQFVLETAPDWFARNGVGPGTLIRAERGSLREVFARQAVLR